MNHPTEPQINYKLWTAGTLWFSLLIFVLKVGIDWILLKRNKS